MPNWTVADITDQVNGFQPAKGVVKPCAFATPGLTQYLAFRGSDNHIYAMWNSIYPTISKWQIVDVSKASGLPSNIMPLTDPTGLWGLKSSVHLFFVGNDNHIYDIYADSYDGPWHWTDLTSEGGGPYVYPTTAPTETLGAYLSPKQNSQCVVYVGEDNNVHRLSPFDGRWKDQNVSAAVVNGNPPKAALHPVGFVWQSQGTEHIFYKGSADTHIHELYCSNATWQQNDLNTASTNPAARADGFPVCYMFDQQGTEHVIYTGELPGDSSKPFELYNDGAWHTTNLCAAANLTPDQIVGFEGPVCGYLFQYEGTQHVIVLGDGHVLEFYWNGSWNFNDLTHTTGAPPPGDSEWISLLAGFAWQDPFGNGSENVEAIVFVGKDGHIYELSFTSDSPATSA